MKMTRDEARIFLYDELLPTVRVSKPAALHTLIEELGTLEEALVSGNSTQVHDIANYISQISGLQNGAQLAQHITEKI